MQTVGTNRRSLSHDRRQTTIGSYPFECVRIEVTCSRFIACTQNPPTLACGFELWGNMCGTCRPQPPLHTLSKYANTRVRGRLWSSTLFQCCPQLPSHTLWKEKTHSLTLLLPNHLDHVNILLRGLRARPPVLSLVPLQANHNLPKSNQQSASESAALAHPQSVARFVSTSTPPESP